MDKRNVRIADLQGLSRLAKEATIEMTDLVEAMHKQIVHPPFLPSTPIQRLITDISGVTYNNVRRGTRLIGGGLERLLGYLRLSLNERQVSTEAEVMKSVLNGILGDHLVKTNNPLQIKMQIRYQSESLVINRDELKKRSKAVSGKILLMVHGSCMNERQWTRKEHNHGLALAKQLNKTALFLRYNSGLHISTNGQTLSDLLENLVESWPVPIEEIIILSHSMGGLVARSSVYYAQKTDKAWVRYLKKVVFLGTPHQGALLERSGNYLDVLLDKIPYTKPLARLAKVRSAGITDLRYGSLLDEDWQGKNRFALAAYKKQHIPLPAQVDCYSIAAVKNKWPRREILAGDGLVGLRSALGQHKQPSQHLQFAPDNTWIAHEHSHLDLLSSDQVFTKIKYWLT